VPLAVFRRQVPHKRTHVGERLSIMTLGITGGRGGARDQFARGKGLLLRNAAGAQDDVNPNAKPSDDLAVDRPNMSLATPQKERG
jgi:hypothetical protein